jgi:hypothetical protein
MGEYRKKKLQGGISKEFFAGVKQNSYFARG